MNRQKHRRIIISGGGTGGHVFPAISIANALKRIDQDTEILFVGAEDRMEMKMVPEAGYRIKGLPVAGFRRGLNFRNISVIIKLFKSLMLAGKIIKEFKPDVAVGVGGYASGPVLWKAARMKIPTLIQEQNSYAGVTNRILAKKASTICVAYEGMEKYFPVEKIIKTGNPVRQNYENLENLRSEALAFFRLSNSSPVILILGGSLGAGSINNSLAGNLDKMISSGCQWLWQTGTDYYDKVNAMVSLSSGKSISVHDFINRMDYAYAAADIIVSRAGAGTISELCLVGKPVILVPSQNVAEDHQTKNALALTYKNAAMLVRDDDAEKHLVDTVISLVSNDDDRKFLSSNIKQMAEKDADVRIAKEVIKLTGK
ncbi:MAG TPA: undecaprenyldiphospho-muramoylpentapeptide beta-N-acetylglucosaminyltransferase [Bacteroidales bacterium]|jgi:UDP-N-acetylglucosamine--N-acetylmuramyl-(pentapeptide) pyrophosphoryl-undecaprenol N-acetylglucosamine transferase|nr:undecaprenyldiphospho-muramoylpentapeptide beta-N-acetylglucosaminyltransferase [Bacteroidales bacterium]OQB62777.1 MAG: UDP-N-acetylglucosamine--N-acetylmuramyl-(pentapeptide) pyrophosphoryl-undecaprenol N-acetylglucosamine transferase [Bacteroidetes bacterium ADurb.Bin145]HOU01959.1 undecaprenyldiphospho-muramoylpentapeptide beta-N-acetylglucosaminyltransferase [Bacteroidales bacterium]HQG62139.1 undecaprenyldiphospho-muramoylpentapeptide beta-N-acetylglucosaminyltransferase [Bacteroidales 